MLCHGFRKFTDTQMIESKMDGLKKEMMLGHDIWLEKSYYRPKDEDVLAEYDKAINNLTINEENRLKRRVEKLEVEASQLDRLQAAVKALEMKIK
jgi:hypothetical protein